MMPGMYQHILWGETLYCHTELAPATGENDQHDVICSREVLACLECKSALVEGPGVRDGGVVGDNVGGSH